MDKKIATLFEILDNRRSHYSLEPEWVVSQEVVEKLVGDTLLKVPTAFNSQPVRAVLLTGENHKEYWQMVEDKLIEMIGKERYDKNTKEKIHSGFMSAVATILWYDDESVTKEMQRDNPTYAPNFPKWAHQVQGSHQLIVWVGLSQLGFGVNLQHYTNLIEDEVKEKFGIPKEWAAIAEMPFGKALDTPAPKDKKPLSETFLIK